MFNDYLLSDDASIYALCGGIYEIDILSQLMEYCRQIYFADTAEGTATGTLKKACFSPAKIIDVLPYIIVLEVKDDDTVFRLAGTMVEPIFDHHSVSGKSVLDFVAPESRDAVFQFFSHANENRLVSFQQEELKLADGEMLSCTTLGFPFEDTDGKARYRISATYYTRIGYHHMKPDGYNVVHSKIYDITFAPLDDFMRVMGSMKQARQGMLK